MRENILKKIRERRD